MLLQRSKKFLSSSNNGHIKFLISILRYGFVIYSPEHSNIRYAMWCDPNLMRCNAETVAVLSRLFSSRRAKSTTVVAWTTVENGWQFFSVDVLDGAISRYIHMSGDCQLNDCGENIDTRDVKKTMQSAPWNLFTNREISDIRDVDCRYWPINIKYIVYTFNIPTYMYITLH